MHFPTTHWSEIARAADVRVEVRRAALGRLLTQYLPALSAFLRVQRRMDADAAEELLQGFVCDRVVADVLVAQVNRSRGRFRSFLLSALDCYALHVRRHERALKRRPDRPVVAVDDYSLSRPEPADGFDVAWARQVIAAAVGRFRAHCEDPRRRHVWEVFEARVLSPLQSDAPAPTCEDLRGRLGLESAAQVSNLVVTAKRGFAKALWSVVGEYAGDEADVAAEIRDLWSVLERAGRQVEALSPAPVGGTEGA